MQFPATQAGEQSGAGPDQRQEDFGEWRVRHRRGAPHEESQDDEAHELARAGSAQLDVQRDFGCQANKHADHIQADIQEEHRAMAGIV